MGDRRRNKCNFDCFNCEQDDCTFNGILPDERRDMESRDLKFSSECALKMERGFSNNLKRRSGDYRSEPPKY